MKWKYDLRPEYTVMKVPVFGPEDDDVPCIPCPRDVCRIVSDGGGGYKAIFTTFRDGNVQIPQEELFAVADLISELVAEDEFMDEIWSGAPESDMVECMDCGMVVKKLESGRVDCPQCGVVR